MCLSSSKSANNSNRSAIKKIRTTGISSQRLLADPTSCTFHYKNRIFERNELMYQQSAVLRGRTVQVRLFK